MKYNTIKSMFQSSHFIQVVEMLNLTLLSLLHAGSYLSNLCTGNLQWNMNFMLHTQ